MYILNVFFGNSFRYFGWILFYHLDGVKIWWFVEIYEWFSMNLIHGVMARKFLKIDNLERYSMSDIEKNMGKKYKIEIWLRCVC